MSKWIDVEPLIKALEEAKTDASEGIKERLKFTRYMIGFCPVADVEPVRHGHWIETGSSRYGHFLFFECSECKRIESCEYDEKIEKIAPYCHCGAKMDGREKEE